MYYKLDYVGIAGDWHSNVTWASTAVHRIADQIRSHGEDEVVIFQLGDFGFWPGSHGERYLEQLNLALEDVNASLYFIDGNHENHVLLRKRAEKQGVLDQQVPVDITSRITWLQRGTRFTLNGKIWLALGGAASVDRTYRTEGQSWFPEERITPEQRDLAIAGGEAFVLLSHDAPAGHHINFPPYPSWPEKDLALSQVNRDYLQDVVEATGVEYLMHGHMHMSYEVIMPKIGPNNVDVRMNCFNCDGATGNWGILDCNTMDWVYGE